MTIRRSLLFSFITAIVIPLSLRAYNLDSLLAKSDLIVTGEVIRQSHCGLSTSDEKYCYSIDIVVFMMSAEPKRYPELLKQLLPGDTICGLKYYTLSPADTITTKQWYGVALVRDSLVVNGWSITGRNRSGIFSDGDLGELAGNPNYINSEYGPAEQKFSIVRGKGISTITTLDGIVREKRGGRFTSKKEIRVHYKYDSKGQLIFKSRAKSRLDKHGVRVITWIYEPRAKRKIRRHRQGIYD